MGWPTMARPIILIFIFSIISLTQCQELWREDGKCGAKYPLDDGSPGQCDPEGDGPRKGPCCSSKGFCGNTVKHCKCKGYTDFSKVLETSVQEKKATVKAETSVQKEKAAVKPVAAKEQEEASTNECGKELSTGSARKIGDSWLDDCNRCRCLKGFKPACTKKLCGSKQGLITTGKAEVNLGDVTLVGEKITEEESSHYVFKGIPYAQSPVGRLRFKAPLPVDKMEGTVDTTKFGSECLQYDVLNKGKLKGSEDCLFLNVYTPSKRFRIQGLPVLVWIHGGGFTIGSSNQYDPTKLLKEDVIVVTINYRLGGFGFLSFGNNKISGNMGLKDQALAIDWVRENIGEFGGDPERITIFGESAGGMSAHAHVLSPRNVGKIVGAIAMSGTMLAFGAELPNDEGLMAKQLSSGVNCTNSLDQATLYCLQQVDAVELLAKMNKINDDTETGVWAPVVDSFSSEPFLPMQPLEAMVRGQFNKVPFISGTLQNDGWFSAKYYRQILGFTPEDSDDLITFNAAKALSLVPPGRKPEGEALLVAKIMRKIAQGEENGWYKIVNDAAFFIPDQVTVKSMVQHNENVFNYIFTEKNDWSWLGQLFNFSVDTSPHHGDELPFLFDLTTIERAEKPVFTQAEKQLEADMIQLWTNFAKYGRPTPEENSEGLPQWEPLTLKSGGYMNLTSSSTMESSHLYPLKTHLWKRMVWGPAIDSIEARMVYERASQFLAEQLSARVGQNTILL